MIDEKLRLHSLVHKYSTFNPLFLRSAPETRPVHNFRAHQFIPELNCTVCTMGPFKTLKLNHANRTGAFFLLSLRSNWFSDNSAFMLVIYLQILIGTSRHADQFQFSHFLICFWRFSYFQLDLRFSVFMVGLFNKWRMRTFLMLFIKVDRKRL